MSPKISVASPAHNEEGLLATFIERTKAALEKTGLSWEIVITDDGSQDSTWEIITAATAADPRIRGFKLSRNFGHQRALVRAMEETKGEIVCTLDSDLQDPPELIPCMIEKLQQENAGLVYGQRAKRKKIGPVLNFCYVSYYRILEWLSGTPIPKDTGDFRVATRQVVDAVLHMKESHDFLRGAFAWVGFKQIAFRYDREGRDAGKSSYTLSRLMELAVNGIWGFSMKPLRLAITLALALAAAALVWTFHILIGYALGNQTPPGWASLAITILVVGSANLLALGTIAEYIGQILKITRNRPGTLVEAKSEKTP